MEPTLPALRTDGGTMTAVSQPPRISVCMPAYNATATIDATLESLWAQSLSEFEVVIVDDASTDSTREHLRAILDPRLRVLRNGTNAKAPATGNRALAFARGEYVKFLDSDDLLKPGCLEALSGALDRHPSASMAFCRRDLLLDEPQDPQSQAWAAEYASPPDNFGNLAELNSGPALLSQWLRAGLPGNWIGEPVTVMARTAAARAAGGFAERAVQDFDFSLWCKLMLKGDVAFVDAVHTTYRVRAGSITRDNKRSARDWLDRAWIAEGIAAHDPGVPGLPTVRRRNLHRALSDFGREPSKERARQLAAFCAAVLGRRRR